MLWFNFSKECPYFRETQINSYIKQIVKCQNVSLNINEEHACVIYTSTMWTRPLLKRLNEMMELGRKLRWDDIRKTQLMIDAVIYKGLLYAIEVRNI